MQAPRSTSGKKCFALPSPAPRSTSGKKCFALPSPAPRSTSGRRYSLDHARLELLELLLVLRAHLLEQAQGRLRLDLVDLGEREADVDEHPVAGAGAAVVVGVEQADVDRAANPGDVDLGEPVELVDNLDDLAGDGQAHGVLPSEGGTSPPPDPTPRP